MSLWVLVPTEDGAGSEECLLDPKSTLAELLKRGSHDDEAGD